MFRTTHTAVGKGCSTWTLHHAVRGMLGTCMYRTCHGTTAGPSLARSNTTWERERETSQNQKEQGNTMNPTEAATDSCWSVCHSLRGMVCSLTVSIWTAHCTSTHQVSRRGCARQLLPCPTRSRSTSSTCWNRPSYASSHNHR